MSIPALIFRVDGHDGVGRLDIAGRWLLERQLQWLRGQGIEQIAVEIGPTDADVELSEFLLGDDPLVSQVSVIPSDTPLGPDALRQRADFDPESGVLELPADVLCETSLAPLIERAQAANVELRPPPGCDAEGATLALRFVFGEAQPVAQQPDGWGARVHTEQTALNLTCQLLDGSLQGPLLHAAQERPGVWISRAAHVSPEARLVAPLLIGSGAYVAAGAAVGPRAVLEPFAVVQRGASVSDARVLTNTLVGEGMQVRRVAAGPRGLRSLRDRATLETEDLLVLDVRRAPARANFVARTLALLLGLILLSPWLLAALLGGLFGRRPVSRQQWPDGAWLHDGALGLRWLDLCPRLWDVIVGGRFLMGSRHPQNVSCAGAIDVGRGLGPRTPELRDRMWPWYAAHKSPALDWRLLTRRES